MKVGDLVKVQRYFGIDNCQAWGIIVKECNENGYWRIFEQVTGKLYWYNKESVVPYESR